MLKDLSLDRNDASHRNQSLDIATERFLECLDRKRSDEYFLRWLREHLEADEV